MSLSPARQRLLVAGLLDHFNLDLEGFAKLTDAQIMDLYYHKRNKEGALAVDDAGGEAPDRPLSLAEELAQLEMLFAIAPDTPEQKKDELRAQLRARHGEAEQGRGPERPAGGRPDGAGGVPG